MAEELKLKGIKVSKLMEIDESQNFLMGFEVLAGGAGLEKEITCPETNRPGLTLSGFFEHFASERIQVLGRGEVAYIEKLVSDNETANIDKFFEFDIPVCIVSNGLNLPQYVLEIADMRAVPVLRTKLETEKFFPLISTILDDLFAAYAVFHGNFVSIYNIGVMILGASGIGKSESVLGLVERGHKFICDDMVRVKKLRTPGGFELKGEPYVDYGPYIEIRGIGIINVSQYYGEGRVLNFELLGLVVNLIEWRSDYNYDRLGMEEKYMNILGIDVPMKEIPVSSGRNIPLLIEVAAYREVMRRLGYNSAEELERKVINFMKKERDFE
ncbi:MAG: HPr(Ser) kinase/phosphatase [Spirochaetes bacterium GWF1_51_8]|nr:MAG: HPr(Ser) kinase/phosphatase [Spirochaetes bacterium GWF1_51_8]